MEWVQVITIVLSLAGVIYWFKNDLQKDINRLESDIEAVKSSLENKIQVLDSDMKSSKVSLDEAIRHASNRSDRLYDIMISLLKERRDPKTNP